MTPELARRPRQLQRRRRAARRAAVRSRAEADGLRLGSRGRGQRVGRRQRRHCRGVRARRRGCCATRENVGLRPRRQPGAGARRSAPLVLIMNPDCRLEPGALAALRAELERHDRCAMVGPRILDPDGSVQGSARGDPDMLTGLFGRTSALRRLLPWLTLSRRNVVADAAIASGEGSVVVDWVSGACMLGAPRGARRGGRVRRALLPVLGGRRSLPPAARGRVPRPLRARRDRHASRRPLEPHRPGRVDPRLPRQRLSLLRDARGAGTVSTPSGSLARVLLGRVPLALDQDLRR